MARCLASSSSILSDQLWGCRRKKKEGHEEEVFYFCFSFHHFSLFLLIRGVFSNFSSFFLHRSRLYTLTNFCSQRTIPPTGRPRQKDRVLKLLPWKITQHNTPFTPHHNTHNTTHNTPLHTHTHTHTHINPPRACPACDAPAPNRPAVASPPQTRPLHFCCCDGRCCCCCCFCLCSSSSLQALQRVKKRFSGVHAVRCV